MTQFPSLARLAGTLAGILISAAATAQTGAGLEMVTDLDNNFDPGSTATPKRPSSSAYSKMVVSQGQLVYRAKVGTAHSWASMPAGGTVALRKAALRTGICDDVVVCGDRVIAAVKGGISPASHSLESFDVGQLLSSHVTYAGYRDGVGIPGWETFWGSYLRYLDLASAGGRVYFPRRLTYISENQDFGEGGIESLSAVLDDRQVHNGGWIQYHWFGQRYTFATQAGLLYYGTVNAQEVADAVYTTGTGGFLSTELGPGMVFVDGDGLVGSRGNELIRTDSAGLGAQSLGFLEEGSVPTAGTFLDEDTIVVAVKHGTEREIVRFDGTTVTPLIPLDKDPRREVLTVRDDSPPVRTSHAFFFTDGVIGDPFGSPYTRPWDTVRIHRTDGSVGGSEELFTQGFVYEEYALIGDKLVVSHPTPAGFEIFSVGGPGEPYRLLATFPPVPDDARTDLHWGPPRDFVAFDGYLYFRAATPQTGEELWRIPLSRLTDAPEATPSPIPTATPSPSATPSPTQSPSPTASATPTSSPTPTATPTPTPAVEDFTGDGVVDAADARQLLIALNAVLGR